MFRKWSFWFRLGSHPFEDLGRVPIGFWTLGRGLIKFRLQKCSAKDFFLAPARAVLHALEGPPWIGRRAHADGLPECSGGSRKAPRRSRRGSGMPREGFGKAPRRLRDLPGRLPEGSGKAPRAPGRFQEVSRKAPGRFREGSRKVPGPSGKAPGRLQEGSGSSQEGTRKVPGRFRECSGKAPKAP